MFWNNKLLKKENIENKHLILNRDNNARLTINEINNNQLINKNLVLNNNENIKPILNPSIFQKSTIFNNQKNFSDTKNYQEVDIRRREFFKKALKVGSLAGVGALLAKPALAGVIFQTSGIDRITIDDSGNTTGIYPGNLVRNSDFGMWEAGTAVAPDWWVLSGVGAAVARESGATNIQYGIYSAKVTAANGAASAILSLDVSNLSLGMADGTLCKYFAGVTVSASVMVKAQNTTANNRARININDGNSTTNGDWNTTTSWEKLTVTHTIHATLATQLDVELEVENGSGGTNVAYFDGVSLTQGSTTPNWSPCWLDGTLIHMENIAVAQGTTGANAGITGMPRKPKMALVHASADAPLADGGASIGVDGTFRPSEVQTMRSNKDANARLPWNYGNQVTTSIFLVSSTSLGAQRGVDIVFQDDGVTWTDEADATGINIHLRITLWM